MLSLGPLAFASPWALGALALAPLLWLLLRLLPPAPRRQAFPPLALLAGTRSAQDASARSPWWVMALRLLLVALLAAAAAGPVLHPRPSGPAVPLVLVIDDGWAAAPDWPRRQAHAEAVLRQADRLGRPVRLVTTAPPLAADDSLTAAQALTRLAGLEPKPWPTHRAELLARVKAWPRDQVTEAVWLADGIEDGSGWALAGALQTLGGGVEMVMAPPPLLLFPPDESGASDRLTAQLARPGAADTARRLAIRAVDAKGSVLARTEAELAPGRTETTAEMVLPADLRNQVARLEAEGERGAGLVALLDDRWQRPAVGLVGPPGSGAPLLAPLYYVERGLAPFADLHRGEVGSLIERGATMLVLADVAPLAPSAARQLAAWVEAGGVLVRFAGPETARAAAGRGSADPLLPVPLRDGGRTLGGAMSWTTPHGLAPFPDHSPFAGLPVPADVRVSSQVLAEPSPELAERSWASLADGTPLVTGRRQGKGWVVLVHTTANAEWSNLPLSGLFVDMMRRLGRLAGRGALPAASGPAVPVEVLDGFGRLIAPGPLVTARPDGAAPGPKHPPGYYGEGAARRAVNLAPLLGTVRPLAPPPGVRASGLDAPYGERDLRGPLLLAAALLALVDLMVSLALRGLLVRAAAAALLFGLAAGPATAAGPPPPEAALATRLAWVRTHDPEADRKSAAGLKALSKAVGQRSTARLAAPVGIDLERDPIHLYPLLYWPAGVAQTPPSPAAAARLAAYMRAGGMIVLETGGDGAADAAQSVRMVTAELALPPLVPVGPDHVLARSFYLLPEQPGRFTGPAWVAEAGSGGQDGVSPVVVSANDWAGAWATDERDRPLYACVPGGERQREMAVRVGVNLVMYALTGNYKADQVHLPAILERLGR